MTRRDGRDLIEAATPLPWRFEDDEYLHAPTEELPHFGTQLNWDTEGLGGVWRNDYDKDLIVYAVNNLPALLDVRDALERLLEAISEGGGIQRDAEAEGYRALARLQEGEPTNG